MVVVVAVAELGLKVCTKLRGLDKEGPRIESAYPHSPHVLHSTYRFYTMILPGTIVRAIEGSTQREDKPLYNGTTKVSLHPPRNGR